VIAVHIEGVMDLPFEDRREAGRLLAMNDRVQRAAEHAIVLALPRGGVPVGFGIAKKYQIPLDIVIVRKLGVPWRPELAMGAISGGSAMFLDEELIRELGIFESDVLGVVAKERAELQRREKLYRGDRPAPTLRGRNVLLVDDGLATGSSMLAAARSVNGALREDSRGGEVIAAVPVGSTEACQLLADEGYRCICLATPDPLRSVGEWYRDFRQVTDEEVHALLEESRGFGRGEARAGPHAVRSW
jgi:putative phosphoribosyl transferase